MKILLTAVDMARLDTAVETTAARFDQLTRQGMLRAGWRARLVPLETLSVAMGDDNSVLRRVTRLDILPSLKLMNVPIVLTEVFSTLRDLGLTGRAPELDYLRHSWIEEAKRDTGRRPLPRSA